MKKPYSGFTLLELMCCIAILAIGLCFGISNGYQLLLRYELNTRSQTIQSAVRYARFLAHSNGATYQLSPLSEEKDWSYGIQLHKIENMSISSLHSTIIYTWRWDNARIKIKWLGALHKPYILFSPYPNHAMCSGHFSLAINGLQNKIVLNRLGRLIETEVTHE